MPEPVTLVGVGGGILSLLVHLARRYFEAAKEVLDIVLGFVALAVSLPVLGVCAVIIKLSSKGPVFYKQLRVGKRGKTFKLYKLRTMYAGAESVTGAVWASRRDPRVVPTCRWMRRSHVDELPQLINVIKGEMSIVGPRPERPEMAEKLEKLLPDFKKRLSVRPGITGLAQVNSGYDGSVEGARRKLEADLQYIERRKWSTELRILLRTLARFYDKQAC
jgi:lipopolysaccharide/colanic/teichoic acid biosynthesis glycosyltransferase